MIIVNDDRKVISHHGVKGMKWGVRKDKYASNRQKAKNIMNRPAFGQKYNKSDIKDAKWMAKSVPEKVLNSMSMSVLPRLTTSFLDGSFDTILENPTLLKKELLKTATRAAIDFGLKEYEGTAALKRYTQEGKQDKTQKQYKGKTPQDLISTIVRTGVIMAPYIAHIGKFALADALEKKKENQARVDKWGQNILPEPGKTSQTHTIYDDGYMSILERIKP